MMFLAKWVIANIIVGIVFFYVLCSVIGFHPLFVFGIYLVIMLPMLRLIMRHDNREVNTEEIHWRE